MAGVEIAPQNPIIAPRRKIWIYNALSRLALSAKRIAANLRNCESRKKSRFRVVLSLLPN